MLGAAAAVGQVGGDAPGPGFPRKLRVQPDHKVAEVVMRLARMGFDHRHFSAQRVG
jgi:hypothetical protein